MVHGCVAVIAQIVQELDEEPTYSLTWSFVSV